MKECYLKSLLIFLASFRKMSQHDFGFYKKSLCFFYVRLINDFIQHRMTILIVTRLNKHRNMILCFRISRIWVFKIFFPEVKRWPQSLWYSFQGEGGSMPQLYPSLQKLKVSTPISWNTLLSRHIKSSMSRSQAGGATADALLSSPSSVWSSQWLVSYEYLKH